MALHIGRDGFMGLNILQSSSSLAKVMFYQWQSDITVNNHTRYRKTSRQKLD
jgi:hypothetical protein